MQIQIKLQPLKLKWIIIARAPNTNQLVVVRVGLVENCDLSCSQIAVSQMMQLTNQNKQTKKKLMRTGYTLHRFDCPWCTFSWFFTLQTYQVKGTCVGWADTTCRFPGLFALKHFRSVSERRNCSVQSVEVVTMFFFSFFMKHVGDSKIRIWPPNCVGVKFVFFFRKPNN